VDRSQIARFAGATGDYGPLHVDEPFARNAGFPSVLVPGMLAMGFLGELVTDWLRGARVRRFGARFVKIVWPGDVVTVRGRVADRRFEAAGRYAVDIEVWGENPRGELVVRGAVTAQLYYNGDDETRQRTGQPPLLVTPAEEEERLAKLSRSTAPARPAVGTRPVVAPSKPQPARPQPVPPKVAPRPEPKPQPKPASRPTPRPAPPRKAPATRPAPRKSPAKKASPKKASPKKASLKRASRPASKAKPGKRR
jgi:acyl dehydratase